MMQRCGVMARSSPLLAWSLWGSKGSSAASARALMNDTADGLGQSDAGQNYSNIGAQNGVSGGGAGRLPSRGSFYPGTAESPGTSVPTDEIDEILIKRAPHLYGSRRMPVSYDIEVQHAARKREEQLKEEKAEFDAAYDEWNMPRHPEDPNRKLASWEFRPTQEHKSLVLLLYRNVLKSLMDYKSIRKRSMIAYTRMCFRRRAHITEKLLVDECIEECRRALYVLGKHHAFTTTRNYEFENMSIPKDTGQDVKTYMEEVYDPEISRMQFQNFTDVQPGKEHLHQQKLSPTSGEHHWKGQANSTSYKVEIREEDKVLRPPPPPDMS